LYYEPDEITRLAFLFGEKMTRSLSGKNGKVEVEMGTTWKLYDNNNLNKSVSIYFGSVLKTKERIFWIETDDGGFVVDPSDDLSEWSLKTKISVTKLKEILQDPKNQYLGKKIA
jgi:hypothetical protein